MAELKNMTVVTSGKLRKTAYDLLDANTNLLAWKEGGRTPADIFDGWLAQANALYSIGNIKINGALLDKAPNLKVIAQASVGYDNIDLSEYVNPPLTTIAQPVFEMGQVAFRTLLQRIEQPDAPAQKIKLPVELVVRESSRKV